MGVGAALGMALRAKRVKEKWMEPSVDLNIFGDVAVEDMYAYGFSSGVRKFEGVICTSMWMTDMGGVVV